MTQFRRANWREQQKLICLEKRRRRHGIRQGSNKPLFRGGDWSNLKFSKTDWNAEDFSNCNLQGADLSRCSFAGANVTGAKFWNCNMEEADLTGAVGLIGQQLAGSNLRRAKLPPEISAFPGIQQVTALSETTAKVFLVMLGIIAFTVLTIASSKDLDLFVSRQGTTLPLIGVQIPLLGFHATMPILLLLIYLYLHLYLQRLWDTLSLLPAILPDGRRLDEATHPWFMNDLVRDYFPALRLARSPKSFAQSWLSRLLAWWLLPITMWFLWANGLRAQINLLTRWQVTAVCLATGAGIWFHLLLRPTFRFVRLAGHNAERRAEWKCLVVAICGLLAVGILLRQWSTGVLDFPLLHDDRSINSKMFWPESLRALWLSPFPRLENTEVSIKPPTWTGTKELANKELALVRGAQLENRSMRNSSGYNAFFVNSDLQTVDLTNSHFIMGDFRGARLRGVQAELTMFNNAQFSNRFGQGSLSAYNPDEPLALEKLAGLTFNTCYFPSALFLDSSFDQVTAYNCNFKHTFFNGSRASQTIFLDCSFPFAVWKNAIMRDVVFICSNDRIKSRPNGTDFMFSDFENADCREVFFGKCDMSHADLQGTILAGADLSQAFGLTVEQLQKAATLKDAKLPPDLQKILSGRVATDTQVETVQQLKDNEKDAEPRPHE